MYYELMKPNGEIITVDSVKELGRIGCLVTGRYEFDNIKLLSVYEKHPYLDAKYYVVLKKYAFKDYSGEELYDYLYNNIINSEDYDDFSSYNCLIYNMCEYIASKGKDAVLDFLKEHYEFDAFGSHYHPIELECSNKEEAFKYYKCVKEKKGDLYD